MPLRSLLSFLSVAAAALMAAAHLNLPDTWVANLLAGPQHGPQTLDGIVTRAAAGFLVVALTGLAASLALTVVDVATKERWHWLHSFCVAWCPRWGRRVTLVLCGLSVTLPATGASSLAASPSLAGEGGDGGCRSSCDIRVDGLPLPDLPAREQALPEQRPWVVVRPGDCLWTIARRGLDRGASNADVARSVQAWYAANAATIGPDPDLIFPGTHLNKPEDSR